MCSRCSFGQQIDCTHQSAYLSFEFFSFAILCSKNPLISSGSGRSRCQTGARSTPFDSPCSFRSSQQLRAPFPAVERLLALPSAFGQNIVFLTKGARKRSPMSTCLTSALKCVLDAVFDRESFARIRAPTCPMNF
jgi:hypothetical protein